MGPIRPVSLRDLGQVSPSSFNDANYIFRGKIQDILRLDARPVVFTLVGIADDHDSRVRIEARGTWTRRLEAHALFKPGNDILIKAERGILTTEDGGVKVVYERGISGYFLPGDVAFDFSSSQSDERARQKPLMCDRSIQTSVEMKDQACQTQAGVFFPTPTLPPPRKKKRSIETAQDEEPSKKKRKVDLRLQISDRTAYTPLVDVKHGTVDDLRNFAVVVVSARVFEPRQGHESSLVRLRVTDPSLDRDDDGGDTQEIPTIDVEWYEQDRTRIPNFVPRHVLLARNFSVARGKITRVHNSWSLALDPDELVNPELRASHVGRPFRGGPKGNTNLELSEPEIAHAARLAEIYHERPFPAAEKVAAKPARVGRLREIKDVEPDHFCDLYAEVVKCYVPADDRSPVSLYVTDYTENAQLVDYSSTSHSSSHASSRQFPPGRQTLQVSIFDHQFEPLAHVSERGDLVGRFVRIDNLRPKLQGDDLLECTLVDDAKFPAKRYLRLLPKGGFLADPIKALLRRKHARK